MDGRDVNLARTLADRPDGDPTVGLSNDNEQPIIQETGFEQPLELIATVRNTQGRVTLVNDAFRFIAASVENVSNLQLPTIPVIA